MNTPKLILHFVTVLGICIFSANTAHATTWYVRDGGGTATQCTGTTNAVYPGSGSAQPCAFNHPAWALGASGGTTKMVGGDTLYIAGDSDNTWNFTVSGVNTLPAVGDEYTTNGATYTVTVSMPVGVTSGQIAMTGPAALPSSGTLTVVSGHGSGTSPITYTAKSVAKSEYMIGYGMPNNNCSTSNAKSCYMNTVPEGSSSSAETRILGLVGSDGLMPQLWGTLGVNHILDLTGGGNYDVENLEITQHSSCSYATLSLAINDGIYPSSCGQGGGESGSYPYGPSVAASTWAEFGISMIGTNFTTANLWVHNIGFSILDWEGKVSNWNSTNDRFIASGASLTTNENGTMSFGGTNTMTNDIWAWGGCQEKYPLPDPGNVKNLNNYINCADQGYSAAYGSASQALGGGFMMQNGTNGACGNWNVYGSQFLFNLKTNWDFLHCDGTGQVNVYRSRFEGSTGENFKATVAGVNLEEDQFIGNAPVWTTAQFQNLLAPNYTSSGWSLDVCRGDANVIFSTVTNDTFNLVNDDIFSNCTAGIQAENGSFSFNTCTGVTLNVYNSKIINGYAYDNGGKSTNSALNSCGTGSGATQSPFTVLKNTAIYNDNHSAANGYSNVCTSGNGNLCATDPLVMAEASPNSFSTMFGCNPGNCSSQTSYYSGTNLGDLLYLQSSSPLRNAGTTSGVTYTNGSSNDYNNYAVTDASPKVDVGALQYNSCIASSTGSTNGYCSISSQCCGGSCNSEGQCATSSSASQPVVSITNPSNGSSVSAGSNISITATASENNGTITNIALYSGSTLLGSSSTSPYTYVMTDPADGTYTLTAVATDANGVSTTSSPVTVTVIAQSITPSSPVVTITSPASGSSYTLGSNVTITATASETNGTISNIALYNGLGILLGSSSASPYNYVYTDILAGTYTFYAVATDANGVPTTSSSITVTVTTPNLAPSIITQPISVVVAAPATATYLVVATGTPAPTYQWQQESPGASTYTNISGATSASYTTLATTAAENGTKFQCIVTNSAGSVTSSLVTLTVDAAPNMTTQPVSQTIASGATANFSVAATGTPAPSYQWYQETPGASTYSAISGATSSSYTTPAMTTANSGTQYECVVTNSLGNVTSTAATLTVNSSAVPVVAITTPINGGTFIRGSTFTISATASESGGTIASVSFYTGTTLLETLTQPPYTITWENSSRNSYALTAVAKDTNGVSTTSSVVNTTVIPPSVAITSPTNGSTLTAGSNVTLTANASETGGTIAQVQFYNGSTLLGTVSTSPYSYTWTNVPAGSYSLTAVATDAEGVPTTSNAVSVTIAAADITEETITASAGTGGAITPSGSVSVDYGASQIFTVSPNAGYTASLTVDGSPVTLTNNTYTLNNVTTSHTVAASFALQSETVTASAGSGGTINPSGTVSVNYGASQIFTVSPNAGYTASLTVDGSPVTLTNNTYTLNNVTTSHTVAASFALQSETVTASAGSGGTINPSGTVSVNYGASQIFTVSPNAGYTASLTVDGSPVTLTNNTYTLNNVTTSHTVAASFALQSETVTASAGSGGTINPSGTVSVNYGASQIFTVSPNAGYTASLTVDGSPVTLTNNTYTLNNVTTSHTVAASFALQSETVTASAGSGGTINPSGTVSVNYGASQIFTVSPNAGYTASLTVDGSPVTLTNNTYTLNNVTTSHTVAASFALQSETVTASAGSGGTINPSGTVSVNYGASQIFTVSPDAGYSSNLTVDGTAVTLTNNTYTLKDVTTAHTITAGFSQDTYTITASAGSNGAITPTSAIVAYGGSQVFTVTPNSGYTAQLTVDGIPVTLTNNTYTLKDVTTAHTITAGFSQDTYTITASAGSNGAITPTSAIVAYGGSQVFTVTPNSGYTAQLTVDGIPVTLTNNTYTLNNVTATHTLAASFSQNTYAITATAGSNGTITPTDITIAYGGSQVFTLTPDTGYTASLTVDGIAVPLTNNTYTLTNVTATHTLAAAFSQNTYAITATAGSNGSITPTSATVAYGDNQTFTVTPNTGYTASLTVDGTAVTLTNNSYTLSNVSANHTLAASFSLQTNIITASAGTGGTINPSGTVTVNYGTNQTFTISPDTGYSGTLTVDGAAVTLTNNAYTLSDVTTAHTIAANFTLIPVAPKITTQPVSETVTAGTTATFGVAATGTPAPTYQWMQELSGASSFTAIDGATSASLVIQTTTDDSGTQYKCVVTNASGSVTSSTVTLTVTGLPIVAVTGPADGSTLTSGSNINITANASETNGTITNVSFYNGATFLGSSSTAPYNYTLTNVPAGTYTLTAVATDQMNNSTTSSPVIVTVMAPSVAPVITSQPVSVTVTAPGTATFSVSATGTPAPTYQWMQEAPGSSSFTAISGANSASYTTPATTASNSGTQYECAVSNVAGSVTSDAASLTVNVTKQINLF